MNETVVIWNQIYTKVFTLSASTKIKTQLFADDHVTIADSEDNLQRGVFTLRNIAKKYCNANTNRKIRDVGIFRARPGKT